MAGWHGNLRPLDNASAVWIDGICARRGVSLYRLAIESESTHGYISRIRSGNRMPSLAWLDRFVERCQLTEEEAIRAYDMFDLVPAGFRLVKAA